MKNIESRQRILKAWKMCVELITESDYEFSQAVKVASRMHKLQPQEVEVLQPLTQV